LVIVVIFTMELVLSLERPSFHLRLSDAEVRKREHFAQGERDGSHASHK
jgi:hypothetical protein